LLALGHTVRGFLFKRTPTRRARTPTPGPPNFLRDHLSQHRAPGCVRGRALFDKIKLRGYAGGFSLLARFLAKWRRAKTKAAPSISMTASWPAKAETQAIDPTTGWLISPILAAALCIKPLGLPTPAQATKIAALKRASPDFTAMRNWLCASEVNSEPEIPGSSTSG
jgi:hypothetical protein